MQMDRNCKAIWQFGDIIIAFLSSLVCPTSPGSVIWRLTYRSHFRIAGKLWSENGEADNDRSCYWRSSTSRGTGWWPWYTRLGILQTTSQGPIQELVKRSKWAFKDVSRNRTLRFPVSFRLLSPNIRPYCHLLFLLHDILSFYNLLLFFQ